MVYEQRSTKCLDCGEELENDSEEPCPKCGSIRKNVEVELKLEAEAIAGVKEIESQKKGQEINYFLLMVVLVLTFGPPFLGLYISGWIGVIIGLILGVFAFFLGIKAITKTKDTERQIFNN